MGSVPKAVASGIDSLYVTVKGELRSALLGWLQEVRDAAAGDPAPIEFREARPANIQPHGARGYRFLLNLQGFDMALGAANHFPPVKVKLFSEFIHQVGIEEALSEIEGFLRANVFIGDLRIQASRVDVYADVQGWQPLPSDYERFVCRAKFRRRHDEGESSSAMHGYGRQLSGFSFGKGVVVGRIYNKTLEMVSSGEDWPSLLWTDADAETPVWRVEFQYRRGALDSVGIDAAEDAIQKRNALWHYGLEWLTLREPTAHARRVRWPVAGVWEWLRTVSVGSPRCRLVRERKRGASVERLMAGFAGYTSSLAAVAGIDGLSAALDALEPAAAGYLANRGRRFEDVARSKRVMLLDPQPPAGFMTS